MTSKLAGRREALAAALLIVVALLLAARFLLNRGTASRPVVETPIVRAPAPAAPSALVVVDVVGAVRRAGLYRLTQGARVADAVARAGGATAKADLALVNLAAPLADGQQVVVPLRGAATSAAASSSGPPSPAAPVDLNTATAEELDALPGIGPVTAQKIVAYREQHGPFGSVEALDAIPGIGPARIDELKGLVVP